MKKFRFTLDKLKDYKEQVLQLEKNALAQLRADQVQCMNEKEELEKSLKQSGEEFTVKAAAGMSVMEITMFKGYHNAVIEQIKEKDEEIAEFEKKIAKQMNIVVEASKDVNSLEKLHDKQLEDYNFMVQKSEEQFIEEFVSNSAFRQAEAENAL